MEKLSVGTVVRLNDNRYEDCHVLEIFENTATGNIRYKIQTGGSKCWAVMTCKRSDFKITFTIEDAIQIQRDHLNQWKLKLSALCYHDLETAALNSNVGVIKPYDIKRGQQLDTFIHGWKPGIDISTIYFN